MLSKNRIKFIKSLQNKKFRDREGFFVVEGEKAVRELLKEGRGKLVELYLLDGTEWELDDLKGIAVHFISTSDLERISGLRTPNKALAICRIWVDEYQDVEFSLALDGIQDPGNLGTILRLADWYGVNQVICSEDTVDRFNSKVVQATMGSLFRVSLVYTDLSALFETNDKRVYGTLLEGKSVYQSNLKASGFLLLGNEGQGIRPELQSYIHEAIHIPGKGGAESLNVAVATGIFLSEFLRGTFQ
ncbi:MAG: RNA methyltransferase [Bacteroidetes bacterium]|nr:MAG: RNA methyltransferase [Bacteroidota bacterium]